MSVAETQQHLLTTHHAVGMRGLFTDCLVDEDFERAVKEYCLTQYATDDIAVFLKTCDVIELAELLDVFNFWYKYDNNDLHTSHIVAKLRAFRVPLKIVDGCVRVAYSKQDYPILIHEFVGDYSQDVHECSYNEHYVRTDWNGRVMNLRVEESSRCRVPLEHYRLRDSDYQSLMTALVRTYRLWPSNYSSAPIGTYNLSALEQLCVDHFDFKDWLGRYQRPFSLITNQKEPA